MNLFGKISDMVLIFLATSLYAFNRQNMLAESGITSVVLILKALL